MLLQSSDGAGLHSGSAHTISPLLHWQSLQGASLIMVSPFKYFKSPSKQLLGVRVGEVAVVKSEVAVVEEDVEVMGQIGLLEVVFVSVLDNVGVGVLV